MSGNQQHEELPRFEPPVITVQAFYLSGLKRLLDTGECEAFTDSTHLITVRNVFKAGADTDGFIVSFMDWDGKDDGDEMLVRPDFTLYLKWNPINRAVIIADLIRLVKGDN